MSCANGHRAGPVDQVRLAITTAYDPGLGTPLDQLTDVRVVELNGSAVEIVLALTPSNTSRDLGFTDFHLRLRVIFGAVLEMELETRNQSPAPLVYEEALHTYFSISDVRQVAVSGLEKTAYLDKTDGSLRKVQGDAPLRFTKETDQVHLSTTAACVIDDPQWKRRIIVEKSGSNTTVVWNPWIEKTKALADMAPDEWQRMLCVETVNAGGDAVHLAPGATHKMRASIRLA